jgi:hypothetical protein
MRLWRTPSGFTNHVGQLLRFRTSHPWMLLRAHAASGKDPRLRARRTPIRRPRPVYALPPQLGKTDGDSCGAEPETLNDADARNNRFSTLGVTEPN